VPNVKTKPLICIPMGHRWRLAEDIHEILPTLRCSRCGRLRRLAPDLADLSTLGRRRGLRRNVGRF
jgi:hypothetical protein